MKNKLMSLAFGFVLLMSAISNTNATLIDRGNGMIYDDDLDITWLADANYAQTSGYDPDGRMNWNDATAWADNLAITGSNGVVYDDWRLFNADPVNTVCSNLPSFGCVDNELAHLFYEELGMTTGTSITASTDPDYALFSNVQSDTYWSNTNWAANPSNIRIFHTNTGEQNLNAQTNEFYAWAVRAGDVAATTTAVPEPGTLLLLAAGMLGLAGAKRRR